MIRALLGTLRPVGRGLLYVCAVIVLVLVLVLLLLWQGGRLSRDRVAEALRGLRGVKVEPPEIPPGIPEEEWRKIERARREQDADGERQKQELSSLRELTEARLAQARESGREIERREKTLAKDREEFEKGKKDWEQKLKEAAFEDNLRKYEEASPKTVVQLWRALSDDEITRYLRSMRADVASDLLKAMLQEDAFIRVADGGKSRLDAIMARMQKE